MTTTTLPDIRETPTPKALPMRTLPAEAPDVRPPVAEVLLEIRGDTIVNASLYLGQVIVPLGGE